MSPVVVGYVAVVLSHSQREADEARKVKPTSNVMLYYRIQQHKTKCYLALR